MQSETKHGVNILNCIVAVSRNLSIHIAYYVTALTSERTMTNLFHLHDYGKGSLYIASTLPDWKTITDNKINTIIDMDGNSTAITPQVFDQYLYVSYPINDGNALPDLRKLHAVARLAARFLRNGQRVLSRCGSGQNRCALVAGVALTYLGMNGKEIVDLIRQKRQDALYNKVFADYLESLLSVPLL